MAVRVASSPGPELCWTEELVLVGLLDGQQGEADRSAVRFSARLEQDGTSLDEG